jgi:alpha-glucosidase
MERQLDTILPLFKKWGVAGVKYGFVHTGSHRWTTWLYDAVKKAAHYGLMLDIHDEFMPTGWSRTWPNLLTQEGVRGNEEFPDATHNTILPFTRFIAGAADYTYCFNERRLLNTKCHQLALSIINYSPFQTLYWYGRPETYNNRDEIELWKYLPTTWDETKVVDGEPGTSVTIARRKGEEWYVGAITNNDARTITIPLDFLPKKKQYEVWAYTDSDGKVTKQVTNNKELKAFSLVAKGGVALRFIPKK